MERGQTRNILYFPAKGTLICYKCSINLLYSRDSGKSGAWTVQFHLESCWWEDGLDLLPPKTVRVMVCEFGGMGNTRSLLCSSSHPQAVSTGPTSISGIHARDLRNASMQVFPGEHFPVEYFPTECTVFRTPYLDWCEWCQLNTHISPSLKIELVKMWYHNCLTCNFGYISRGNKTRRCSNTWWHS